MSEDRGLLEPGMVLEETRGSEWARAFAAAHDAFIDHDHLTLWFTHAIEAGRTAGYKEALFEPGNRITAMDVERRHNAWLRDLLDRFFTPEEKTMKTYIGIKAVEAEPGLKPGSVKFDGDPGVPGYRIHYPDGYAWWTPKDVFEAAYREVPADDADAIAADLIAELHDAISPRADEGTHGFRLRVTALDMAVQTPDADRSPAAVLARASIYLDFLNGRVSVPAGIEHPAPGGANLRESLAAADPA